MGTRFIIGLSALALSVGATSTRDDILAPGLWEQSFSITIVDAKTGDRWQDTPTKSETHRECYPTGRARDLKTVITEGGKACSFSDFRASNGKVQLTARCSFDETVMVGDFEGSYTTRQVTFGGKMADANKKAPFTIVGEMKTSHIGACPAKK